MIIQFEKRKLSLAGPPAKKTLEEEFRKLGMNTNLVAKIKTKFEDNPTTENDAVDVPSDIMCDYDDQPGVILCDMGVVGLDLVVTGRGKVNTELSHNQYETGAGLDMAETVRGNMYNELGHNQCVPGTGLWFGNMTGLEEECHTYPLGGAEAKHTQLEPSLNHNQNIHN